MSRPVNVQAGPFAAASANNIATSQTPLAAGNLTINGTTATGGVATLDKARRVQITSSSTDSGRVFTIFGTNVGGFNVSESIAGPNASAVLSALDYATVTRIAVTAATSGAITVGTSQLSSSPWVWLNWHGLSQVSIQTNTSGTVNYTVEATDDDVQTNPQLAIWYAHPVVKGGTSGTQDSYPYKPNAIRCTLNSGTGFVVLDVIQAGLADN